MGRCIKQHPISHIKFEDYSFGGRTSGSDTVVGLFFEMN